MGAQGIIPASGSTFQKLTKILIQRDPGAKSVEILDILNRTHWRERGNKEGRAKRWSMGAQGSGCLPKVAKYETKQRTEQVRVQIRADTQADSPTLKKSKK